MYAYIQRLVLVLKMATVLDLCTIDEQHFVVYFLWVKGLNAKYIHEEIFPVYTG
jgi:hypothetical protein